VHVAARLSPDLLARIRSVLAPSDELLQASNWPELTELLRQNPFDLLVIDPSARTADSAAERDADAVFPLTILAEFRGIPAIAYTAYTREAMRALLPLARSGVQQVVLRGFDDTPERLRDLIEQTGARILGQRLLAVLVPKLEQAGAPIEVVDAITRLFHTPQSFRTVPHLAAAAGRQRGMLDRWLRRAGLAPAKVIMIAARVAWVHHYAQSPANRFKVLALRLGYPRPLPLSRHIKWMTGMTPTTLRREMSSDELVDVLVRRIVPRSEAHR
jgi:AraC-like DNA-binding protein